MNVKNALHVAHPPRGRAAKRAAAKEEAAVPLRGLHASPFSAAELRSHAPRIVALVLAIVGVLWVSMTDEFLHRFIDDPRTFVRLETAKGWTFVAIAALTAYVTTARCLDRLHRSEATLRAILRSIGDGVLLVGGRERRVLDANPAAFRILGVRSRSELVGMDAEAFARTFRLSTLDGKLIAPEDYQSQRALRGENVHAYRASIQPASNFPLAGPISTLSITVAPVPPERGETPTLAVSVLHDVTEMTNFERMRDRFFSAAAHALLTPLSTLVTHAELLLRSDVGTARERRHYAAIDRQCMRMDQIVKNLLVLSRLDGGKLELHMTELELAPLVERVARETAERTGADVRVTKAASPLVFGDEERLTLVLRNMSWLLLCGTAATPTIAVEITEHEGRTRVAMSAPAGIDVRAYSLREEMDAALHVNRELVSAHAGTSDLQLSNQPPIAWFELPSLDHRSNE